MAEYLTLISHANDPKCTHSFFVLVLAAHVLQLSADLVLQVADVLVGDLELLDLLDQFQIFLQGTADMKPTSWADLIFSFTVDRRVLMQVMSVRLRVNSSILSENSCT